MCTITSCIENYMYLKTSIFYQKYYSSGHRNSYCTVHALYMGFFLFVVCNFFFLLYCSFTSVGGFSSWNSKWVCFQLSYEPLKVIRMKWNVHIDFGQMLSLVDYLRNLKCCHFTLLGAAGQFSKVVILSSYQSIRTKIWETNYSLISRHMEHES